MKTNRRHHLSEKEITAWVMMVLLFVMSAAAGYLFWQKFAP